MSFRSLATLNILVGGTWLPIGESLHVMIGQKRKRKGISLYPEKSVHFLRFSDFPHVSLSQTSPCLLLRVYAITAHPANISQIHTGNGSWRGEGGGEGQECLQEAEKRKMGGGEGCSGMKASAMMLHRGKRRCQNKTLSLLVTDIFRQFHRLKLDKHRGLVWLEGNRLR